MSNDIGEYSSIKHDGLEDGENMCVTATAQGEYGSAIQFTIGNNYCVLSKNQLLDLIDTIKKRIKNISGHSAVESSNFDVVHPIPNFKGDF